MYFITPEIVEEFIELGIQYLGSYNLRIFRSNFGVCVNVCTVLFTKIQAWQRVNRAQNQWIKKKHILWTLSFLKSYSTNDVAHVPFRVSEKTFREWVWQTLFTLFQSLTEVSL